MGNGGRIELLNVPVDNIGMSDALDCIDKWVQNNDYRKYILAINAEKIIFLQKNTKMRDFYNRASLLLPDGVGVTLASKLIHGLKVSRVTGADLMQLICKNAALKGYKIFLFGGEEEVNRIAVEKLNNSYPGIPVVGRNNGYIEEKNMNKLINKINKAEPDILFLAMGSPMQEIWLQNHLSNLNIKICQAIGGTLDILSEKKKRAPKNIQRLGLEWLYRLISEPKRISRQIVLPVFLMKVIKRRIEIIFRASKSKAG